MQIFHKLDDFRQCRRELPANLSLGFVPTMGNLHLGHKSLFNASCQENDRTVVSIFINPKQFNKIDDYTNYPRTIDADLALLEEQGVDYCLLPIEQEMYADSYQFKLEESNLSLMMEGKLRPGHFTGVLTVVMKLLNLTKPQKAYFGEKDYQQLQLIRQMVMAFFIDTEIKSCPTIREPSGLAFSSRNNRLTPKERQIADKFANIFHQNENPIEQLISELNAQGIEVEYIEEYAERRYAAVKIGDVRLIDNYAALSISTTKSR